MNPRETLAFRVEGMCCAEEVGALRRSLEGRDGVHALGFDLLNAKMTVECDAEVIGAEQIAAAVKTTGLRALPWSDQREEKPQTFWQRHGRLILTAASAACLVAGFAAHFAIAGDLAAALGHAEGAVPAAVLALYVLAIVSAYWNVAPRALGAVRRLRPDMNFLMTAAVIGAAAIGQWFEAASVAFLFALALLLESWSVGRARRAVQALLDLTAPTARVVCPSDGCEEETLIEKVAVGATVRVRPGERIPLDGEVIQGASSVNQAPITGESMPVEKGEGDGVYAGTVNGEGVLDLRVTRPADQTLLARIVRQVQEAHSRRAPAEQWVDRFAAVYTPAMIAASVALMVIPPLALGGAWGAWFYRGLVVLVIACPCALVISTPVAVVAGLASAARRGVLIKGGMFLEMPSRLRTVAFDKTGTLTHGAPRVQEVVPLNGHTADELLARAAAMEAHTDHPLARAITEHARAAGIPVDAVESYRVLPGRGAEGVLGGRRFWIGSDRLMREQSDEAPEITARAEALEDAGHSVVAVGNDSHVCGLISLADSVRDGARAALDALRREGVAHTAMLTGDNAKTATEVAEAVGVDETLSELLPEDKVEAVERLVAERGAVAMVGDGVNDAPAMARASVGIAMGAAGTDAAIETADIALMADDLSALPWLVRHSRRAMSIIRQNITFALGTKAVFLALAVPGWATLWMAIAADMGASLLVIANALRLLRAR